MSNVNNDSENNANATVGSNITPLQFFSLSFTWGIIMTLIGCVASLVLLIAGYKPKRWNLCWYFEVGTGWGGVNLGPCFITQKNYGDDGRNHESGHAIQNCKYGVLHPFIVAIPSAIRYWYREAVRKSNLEKYKQLPDYYSIWFESEASQLGSQWHDNLNKQ